ncbi:MAG: SRPBCC family protein [Candidatus Hydrogenedentales bacterium]|jgi:uncharacterized protein YndB with AHSA1/START domain
MEERMMQEASVPIESIADREIVTTRLLNAPRELVYTVWTEPHHIAQWWGPNGSTNTIHEMDVRVGGVWRFIMHGPDGVDYPNKIVYTEIEKPKRLVYTHSDDSEGATEPFHVTITFDEDNGKTKLTMRIVLASAEEREKVVKFGAIEGGQQTIDRLEAHLAKLTA